MKHHSSYFYIDILASAALGILCGAGIAWFFCNSVPRLAVVDMQALITQQSQHLAKTPSTRKSGKVSLQQIQELSEHLKKDLEAFAAKHNLILLTKGSVMGGTLPDYTDQFLPHRVLSQDDTVSRLSILDRSKSLFRERLREDRP